MVCYICRSAQNIFCVLSSRFSTIHNSFSIVHHRCFWDAGNPVSSDVCFIIYIYNSGHCKTQILCNSGTDCMCILITCPCACMHRTGPVTPMPFVLVFCLNLNLVVSVWQSIQNQPDSTLCDHLLVLHTQMHARTHTYSTFFETVIWMYICYNLWFKILSNIQIHRSRKLEPLPSTFFACRGRYFIWNWRV